jgi:AbrB family looped-hinge helix DNA binding protein
MLRAMRTTIDKAGRVVIPRDVRQRAGLAAGGEVEVGLAGATITIEAVSATEVRQKDGFLVVPRTGSVLDDAAVRAMIDADRDQRG